MNENIVNASVLLCAPMEKWKWIFPSRRSQYVEPLHLFRFIFSKKSIDDLFFWCIWMFNNKKITVYFSSIKHTTICRQYLQISFTIWMISFWEEFGLSIQLMSSNWMDFSESKIVVSDIGGFSNPFIFFFKRMCCWRPPLLTNVGHGSTNFAICMLLHHT